MFNKLNFYLFHIHIAMYIFIIILKNIYVNKMIFDE